MIKNEVKLSREFKTQTAKAVSSILLFALVYLIIVIAAVALTALCVFGGIMLIVSVPRFITLALGIGLASLGFIVLIFLFKFILKSHKVDRSHLHEISKNEEPKLFLLIREIVDQVGTHFPKRVYLSAEVNASVFYNSSFFSMFFPIRKNLQIGLGLVNSVSAQELKAILSHEFGHFSQRTMKVGSYVYNVNQVIYNMLFDNESFDNGMYKWADASGYFAIFVWIAIRIIQGIQWILRKMYDFVNISYMGLSREMEFHADEIAANVTGYEPLKNSLLRLDLADHSYNSVLNFYEGKISENLKGENIYEEHGFVMKFLAMEGEVKLKNDLPDVELYDLTKFNKSKLIIKDQWASHPSVQERVERLAKINIPTSEATDYAANELFADIEQAQKVITKKLFDGVEYPGDLKLNTLPEFEKKYKEEYHNNSLDKIFNGYYDDRNPEPFDILTIPESGTGSKWSDLVSEQKINLVYSTISLQNDIETLKQVASKQYKIKSYDYDGKRYKQRDTYSLLKKLDIALMANNELLKSNDIEIYKFFIKVEKSVGKDEVNRLYQHFFSFDKKYDKKIEIYSKLTEATQFINFTTPFEEIKKNFRDMKKLEVEFKGEINQLIGDKDFMPSITSVIKETFDKYLLKDYQYFANEVYFEENLQVLFTAMDSYYFLLSRVYFLIKKDLLEYKKELLKANPSAI